MGGHRCPTPKIPGNPSVRETEVKDIVIKISHEQKCKARFFFVGQQVSIDSGVRESLGPMHDKENDKTNSNLQPNKATKRLQGHDRWAF